MKKTVLIIENKVLINDIIRDCFEEEGFIITCVKDGLSAVEITEETEFDLILLDIELPGLDGFSVCRHIRKKYDTPIIMVTSVKDEESELKGYAVGADDYVKSPLNPKVLLAKAYVMIKRVRGVAPGSKGDTVAAAGIEINLDAHSVTVDGEGVELTPKEFNLLLTLMENKGRVLTRDTLLSRVWGYDYLGDVRVVDTHIKKLRAKLGKRSVHIKTLIKTGYKFDEKA